MYKIARDIRKNPRPVLIEFKTFRMRGHEETSGTKYVPKELLEQWASKDPIENFQEFLRVENVLTEEMEVKYKSRIVSEINDNLKKAFDESEVSFDLSSELGDVYKNFHFHKITPGKGKSRIRFIAAITITTRLITIPSGPDECINPTGIPNRLSIQLIMYAKNTAPVAIKTPLLNLGVARILPDR